MFFPSSPTKANLGVRSLQCLLFLLLFCLQFPLLFLTHQLPLLSLLQDQRHAVLDSLGHGLVVGFGDIARLNLGEFVKEFLFPVQTTPINVFHLCAECTISCATSSGTSLFRSKENSIASLSLYLPEK